MCCVSAFAQSPEVYALLATDSEGIDNDEELSMHLCYLVKYAACTEYRLDSMIHTL